MTSWFSVVCGRCTGVNRKIFIDGYHMIHNLMIANEYLYLL